MDSYRAAVILAILVNYSYRGCCLWLSWRGTSESVTYESMVAHSALMVINILVTVLLIYDKYIELGIDIGLTLSLSAEFSLSGPLTGMLDSSRPLYRGLALVLSVLGILLCVFSALTPPEISSRLRLSLYSIWLMVALEVVATWIMILHSHKPQALSKAKGVIFKALQCGSMLGMLLYVQYETMLQRTQHQALIIACLYAVPSPLLPLEIQSVLPLIYDAIQAMLRPGCSFFAGVRTMSPLDVELNDTGVVSVDQALSTCITETYEGNVESDSASFDDALLFPERAHFPEHKPAY